MDHQATLTTIYCIRSRKLSKAGFTILTNEVNIPKGLPLGEAEVRVRPGVIDGNGGSLDLVTPAGKVAERIDGETNVCLEGQGVDCSGVNTLQCC